MGVVNMSEKEEEGTRKKKRTPDIADTVTTVTAPSDISAQIGQVLYAIALTAASNDCNCEVCRLARKLGRLLALQLQQGPASPR